jgi:proline dehydrogenase
VAITRRLIVAAAGSAGLRRRIETLPVSRSVVARFVGGTTTADVVRSVQQLATQGLLATIDFLGEDVTDDAGADLTRDAYLELIAALRAARVERVDLSLKLTALGLLIDDQHCLARSREILAAADEAGMTVTLDMEGSALTDVTLRFGTTLRENYPATATVIQAMLGRTDNDARTLATTTARVRLCKGAYHEPATVAYSDRREVTAAYLRALETLWRGAGTPLVATHDPVIISRTEELVAMQPRHFEFQMLYGVRPDEQARLVSAGHVVRVYVPFGDQWYGYLMRRMAEKPANLRLFLRALASRS